MQNMFRFSLIYYLPSGVSTMRNGFYDLLVLIFIYVFIFSVSVYLYFYSICDLENNKW